MCVYTHTHTHTHTYINEHLYDFPPNIPALQNIFCTCFKSLGLSIVYTRKFWGIGHAQLQLNGSVQFRSVRSVISDSLQPHGLQHARPSCPLPTPGVYSNSCPLSR